jgi:hypothetical protein
MQRCRNIVDRIRAQPTKAPWTLLLLVASIEIARANKRGPTIPADLEPDYTAALDLIPTVVAATAQRPWDHWYCIAALSALASAKGHANYAEALQELKPTEVDGFLRRLRGQNESED